MRTPQQEGGRTLTVRGLVIGSIGSVFITMSSMFIALKMSSLPWPIIFVALASMFSLKLLGHSNFGEINVTHTAMSAGAMVAGGMAFTLPGIWILHPEEAPDIRALLAVALGGTVLGLLCTSIIRKHFIEERALEYPMGTAAAETLYAGDEGGGKAKLLFGAMGLTGIFVLLRDGFGRIPTLWLSKRLAGYGASVGFYFSPMLIGIGYLLGPGLLAVWFLGALLGDGGILVLGQSLGWLDTETAAAVKSSLGIGLMVGSGIGILVKGILPRAKEILRASFGGKKGNGVPLRWTALLLALLATAFSVLCHLELLASVLVILGSWFAASMSAESVGRTGINPMEIFGILVLLFVRILSDVGETEAFYIAGIAAVAAGLVGDVMNDLKTGYIMHTRPRDQIIGEAVGGLIGAGVAVLTLYIIFRAYGGSAIGGAAFPAAQAAAVASMVGGIANLPAFVLGVIAAFLLHILGFPVMTLGLGVYLPSYMSATAFLGGLLRLYVDRRRPDRQEQGVIIASGCLGGEGVIGVLLAMILAFQSL